MLPIRSLSAALALLGLAACTTVEPTPGTPEFAAAQVSPAGGGDPAAIVRKPLPSPALNESYAATRMR